MAFLDPGDLGHFNSDLDLDLALFPDHQSLDDIFDFGDLEVASSVSGTSPLNMRQPGPSESTTDCLEEALELVAQGSVVNDRSPDRRGHLKRSLTDMMSSFPLGDDVLQQDKRRRSAFSPERRKQVEKMRKIGTCKRCQARKVSCQLPGPCNACIKAAGGISLGRYICIRQTLLDLRYGSFDLLHQSFTKTYIDKEISEYHGPKREISISLLYDRDSPGAFPLKVVVQDFSSRDTAVPNHCVLVKYPSIAPNFYIVASRRYAIVPGGVPTVQNLLDWAQIDMETAKEHPTFQFIASLTSFMRLYCQHKPEHPLHQLLRASIRFIKLIHIWQSPIMVDPESGDGDLVYLCRAAQRQICVVAKQAIEEAEIEILCTLEHFLYSPKGPGKRNLIPIWACLWSLVLMYRDCMASYKAWSLASIQEHFDYPTLANAAKHMYDILTSIYAALFRVSTPLYLDWRIEEDFDWLWENESLKEAFCNLRASVIRFYEANDQFSPEDNLLWTMVIEEEKKRRPHHLSML